MNTTANESTNLQQEALNQIAEIHKVIEGSNKALFSGERMMVMGVLITLIPLIEKMTTYLTFGHDFGPDAGMIIALIHTAFYWTLFTVVGRLLPFKKSTQANSHPLIQKAFSLSRPFMISIFGLIFVLSLVNQFQLIHPMSLILLGLMFSLYGRFTIPAVTYIAWTYIFIGLAYAAVSNQNIPGLWIYLTAYNGISYFVMGWFLRKENNQRHSQLA